MKRAFRIALMATRAACFGSVTAMVGCNGVLGIERAVLEKDSGSDAGNASTAGDAYDAADAVEGGPGQDAGDPLTCDNYCATMMQNCTGPNLEYLSNTVCMTLCGYMAKGRFYDLGTDPDNVDTLGCRLWHAHSAQKDPAVHCRHAGPLGADLCGGPCEPFCRLDWHFCTDDNGVSVYDGQVTGCETVCSGDAGTSYAYVEGDSGDIVDQTGKTMIETGNTLNCRLWHLETAIDKSMPKTHCPHTGIPSATCQ